MKLTGQTTIVTGSTSGIGKEIALLFASEGANVAVVGRNQERGNKVVSEIEQKGRKAIFIETDVTIESSVKKMVDKVIDTYGSVDILINNAGVVIPGSIPEISKDQWEKTWHTNVTSVYLTSHAVLPHMLSKKEGVIVNISSEAGLKGLKERAAYCAAKAAVVGLTKAMAVDHSGDGIRVNCLCPGTIETEMVKNIIEDSPDPSTTKQMMIDRRLTPYLGTVTEVAEATLFLSSPTSKYMTGTILTLDGGATVK